MPIVSRDEDFISARARVQLMALGIPAAKHVRGALAGTFPSALNISAAGLSTEDLARILIHLGGDGILPLSGEETRPSLKKVKPGWHFCQVYRDFNQLVELVAPYIAEGLENGEGCFWVMPDVVTNEVACAAIARFVEDVDGYLASGQLELMSHRSWYLDAGRFKSFEEIAEGLIKKQDQALSRCFKFLRAAGDAGWVSGTQQSKDFIEYERKVNAALRTTKVAAICTYRAAVTADEFIAIVTAHQDAISKTRAS